MFIGYSYFIDFIVHTVNIFSSNMKFIIAVIAFCAVFALTTAAPRAFYNPYSPQVYGGGTATAYGMIDATSDYYGNNIYGRYPSYGGYNPGYSSYSSIWS